MQETLIIDGHVHLYDVFDLSYAFRVSLRNFINSQRTTKNRHDAIKVWMMTERHNCEVFSRLDSLEIDGYRIDKTKEPESRVVRDADTGEPLFYILAGRQIVTTENLEVCALATLCRCGHKKLSTADTIQSIYENGGIATLNWAPGKWFGARGRIVQNMLDSHLPSKLFISDTTMRPRFWPVPRLMKFALKNGFKLICGSDPLPFPGEENILGSYATLTSGEFDENIPADSVRAIFLNPATDLQPCGHRSGLFSFIRRQWKIMKMRKD